AKRLATAAEQPAHPRAFPATAAFGDAAGAVPGGVAGRFGVGFAAVVAVRDAPEIVSGRGRGGGGWSGQRTRRRVGALAARADAMGLGAGAVPALGLPFALADRVDPPEGFDTVVRLPLRDAVALESVRRQLGQVGPALLLALPALRTVEIVVAGEERTLTADW